MEEQQRTTEEQNSIDELLLSISEETNIKWSLSKIEDRKEVHLESGEGEIYSLNDIGKMFGGGTYRLRYWSAGKSADRKYKNFTLGNHFNIISRKYWEQQNGVSFGAPSPAPAMDSFKMIKEVISLISPLLQQQKPINPFFEIQEFQKVMSQMMQTNLENQLNNNALLIERTLEMQLDKVENNNHIEVEEMPAEKENIISQFLPLLEQFLPNILGGGIQSKTIGAMVKGSQQYKEIVESGDLENIVDAMVDKFGEEKAQTIIKNLGIDF